MSDYSLHFLWDPELSHGVQSYSFSSVMLRDVFLQGVEDSEKAIGGTVHFVPHAGFAWVDGKPVEMDKKLRVKSSLHERYIFWEEDVPERAIPEMVSFDTVDEAACYELGVRAGVGHENAILVPGDAFRILHSYDLAWLPPEVAEAYHQLMNVHQELDDNIIGNPSGQWAEIGWKLGNEIQQVVIPRNPSQNKALDEVFTD